MVYSNVPCNRYSPHKLPCKGRDINHFLLRIYATLFKHSIKSSSACQIRCLKHFSCLHRFQPFEFVPLTIWQHKLAVGISVAQCILTSGTSLEYSLFPELKLEFKLKFLRWHCGGKSLKRLQDCIFNPDYFEFKVTEVCQEILSLPKIEHLFFELLHIDMTTRSSPTPLLFIRACTYHLNTINH